MLSRSLEEYFEIPTQPSLPEPITAPVTQPTAQPRPEPTSTPGEKAWILLPAVGAAVLTILTVCLNAPDEKEKF